MREREKERDRERERERERESERERAREGEREREYYVAFGRRIVDEEAKIRQKKIIPTIFPFVDSGPISLGFSRESLARDMWCFIAYVYNGRERGERETERVPRRIILFTMR